MIIRKPYAFLIKYFKIIHIFMFIIFSYFLFPLRKIYMFFSSYVKTGHFTYFENMSSDYISIYMYIGVVALLISSIFIYFLMHKKEKPILFYRIMIIDTFVLLIMLIVYNNFFNSLEFATYDSVSIVIYRDITGFLYYINYFYIAFSFARGFGFDIKKFSFEKDLKELHITSSDNEEYELLLNIEKEDIVKGLRKEKRELGYYLKENAFALIIIGFIMVIIGGLSIYFNVFVPNKMYTENIEIDGYNNLSFTINQSYLTTKDKYDKVILINDYFVVINLSVKNKKAIDAFIDPLSIRLVTSSNYLYPVYTYYSSFDDLGLGYNKQKIKPGECNNYLLVYKFNKQLYQDDLVLEILSEKNTNNNQYKKVKLDLVLDNKKESEYSLKEKISINEYDLVINDYHISDKETYKYQECINDKCQNYIKNIIPKNNEKVLTINLDYDNSQGINDILENYLGVIYTKNDQEYVIDSQAVSILYKTPDTIYLSVDENIEHNDKISLVITTREQIYQVYIKE